jgi:hypothetical protein
MTDKVVIPTATTIAHDYRVGGLVAVMHQMRHPNQIAQLAGNLAQSALSSGERHVADMHIPVRVAEYCCKLAEALYAQFQERGWLVDLPDPTKPQALPVVGDEGD